VEAITYAQIKALAVKAAEDIGYLWPGEQVERSADAIAAVFTTAILELGPCGKHPKMFMTEMKDVDYYEVTPGGQKKHVFGEQHCTVCAEIAAEREACAKAMEEDQVVHGDQYGTWQGVCEYAKDHARSIRARGDKK